jgi:uncharacterized membrane protein YozB (DUF420 family)
MATQAARFAPFHRRDRAFFAVFVTICWLGVLMGFFPASSARLQGKADYVAPLILHVHAASFVAWLLLLTAQTTLIRRGNVALHRRLGPIGMALIPVMALSGFFAEGYSQRFYLAHPPNSQAFFIIPIWYVVSFTAFATWAMIERRDPSAHKRLLLLATTLIVGAAYARWWGETLTGWVGDGFWGMIVNSFTGTHLILLGSLAYDYATRGRVHRVYLIGIPAILAGELVVSWLYHSPAWLPVAYAIASSVPGPPLTS